MKDSSGSFTLLGEFNQAATRVNRDFACMSGSVGLHAAGVQHRHQGMRLGNGKRLSRLTVALYRALEAHDWEKFRELQNLRHCRT